MRTRLTELSKDKPIVAYCREPFCPVSADAVRLLQAQGYSAFQMREGVAEWAATSTAGLPPGTRNA
ncbi:rhodanese-like domain-containing protein [Paraburkholderia sediminicola]|uniref:rhodanese-like domain-containing protein n=1 Tax=Paraburkholderia sediminicola TaxID=458836 RepID=UPI0038B76C7B